MAQAKVLYVVMAAGASADVGAGGPTRESARRRRSGLADRLVELGLLQPARGAGRPAAGRWSATTPEAVALLERFRELNQRQLRELLEPARGRASSRSSSRSVEVLGGRSTVAMPITTDDRSTTTIHQGETQPVSRLSRTWP